MNIFHGEIRQAEYDLLATLNEKRISLSEKITQSLIESLVDKLFNLSKRFLAIEYKNGTINPALIPVNPRQKKDFLDKYAVLNAQITLTIQQWHSNSLNLFIRWHQDKLQLASELNLESLGEPISISSDLGDSHCNGQSTCILNLSSGIALVYKPRSLKVDMAFFSFAKEWGFKELYQPVMMTKYGYGWMEFVGQSECRSREEIKQFYFQTGLILALAYCLDASDLHSGNWLAHGQFPVPIDLETLFQHQDDSVVRQGNRTTDNHPFFSYYFFNWFIGFTSK